MKKKTNKIYSSLRNKILCKEVPERFNPKIHKSYIPYMLYKVQDQVHWDCTSSEDELLSNLIKYLPLTESSIKTLNKMFKHFKDSNEGMDLTKIDEEMLNAYGDDAIFTYRTLSFNITDLNKIAQILNYNGEFMLAYYRAGFYFGLKTILISGMRCLQDTPEVAKYKAQYDKLIRDFNYMDLSTLAKEFYTTLTEASLMTKTLLLSTVPKSGKRLRKDYRLQKTSTFLK